SARWSVLGSRGGELPVRRRRRSGSLFPSKTAGVPASVKPNGLEDTNLNGPLAHKHKHSKNDYDDRDTDRNDQCQLDSILRGAECAKNIVVLSILRDDIVLLPKCV